MAMNWQKEYLLLRLKGDSNFIFWREISGALRDNDKIKSSVNLIVGNHKNER